MMMNIKIWKIQMEKRQKKEQLGIAQLVRNKMSPKKQIKPQSMQMILNQWDRVLDSRASCLNKNLQDITNSEKE